ncbi:methyltransferase domain-containing protein [Thermodesulfatator atlanticus]|uniref:methyltransferase domain-containing protein n=1 Tax=Thermodesulfatator atlanticus TaxID=501497 RepID=UPI0003B51904|nr:methyltransferase domain-containing protein [Thermodesulfatator atlanticus]
MLKLPERVLELEVMLSLEEVRAYDGLVRKYLKILHFGFLETIINFAPEEGLFLDIGTGTGHLAIELAKLCPKISIVAVDLSENMLTVARENAQKEGVLERINFMKADAKNIPFPSESFDCVYCHNMLHHIPQPIELLREIKRVAKKDAAILVRDLIRLTPLERAFHVNVFGATYTELMKKEYEDSIKAALSKEEWCELAQIIAIPGARVTYQFVTHQSLERPSSRRRKKYFKVPVPPQIRIATSFYISKPYDWHLPKPETKLSPEIETVLKAASWAPSGDNLQPWRFKLEGENTIHFLYDPVVDTSFFNFEQNATIFAVGAALENASYLLEKAHIGHNFEFSPEKQDRYHKLVVLKIKWPKEKADLEDILLKSPVVKRTTNRKLYERKDLTEKAREKIISCGKDLGIEVKILEGKKLEDLAELLYLADLIRVERKDLHEFLHDTIRWCPSCQVLGDGMPIKSLEAGAPGELVLKATRPWSVMKNLNKLGFARAMAEHTKKLALSSSGIMAFCAESLDEKAYFNVGRACERAWLSLTEMGLFAQPLAAAPLFMIRWQKGRWFDFTARHQFFMQKIARGFERLGLKNCLMFLRFGVAEPPSARAPRKPVTDFVIS